MRIVVAIKQVPDTEEMRFDPSTRTLVREGVTLEINPYDKRALTEAMRLRAEHGGEVVALTMGPPQAREALVECLGRGVDRTIHVTDRALAGSDTLATSRVLAAAINRLEFDIVLMGKFSVDSETGQVGPEVATRLDIPYVTGVTAITIQTGGNLLVRRETDFGFEEIEVAAPVLFTAAERLIKPIKTSPDVIALGESRIASDPALIETVGIAALGLSADEVGLQGSPTWVAELRPVEVERERRILQGEPISVARSLLLALRSRGIRSGPAGPVHDRPQPPRPPKSPVPGREIWAVVEWVPGPSDERPHLREVSYELAGEAARLARAMNGQAVALIAGSGVEHHAQALAQHGAALTLVADDPRLATYSAERYARVVSEAIKERGPVAVLFPATSFGRDLAPRVAALLGLGLTGDCTGMEVDPRGRLLQLKPAFGGQVLAPIVSSVLPAMATLRPGVFPRYSPDPSRTARVERLNLSGLPPSRTRVVSTTFEGEDGLALDHAHLVVSVGMGVGGPEALPEIERLAAALGDWMGVPPEMVAVGGTRKVVDAGWLPRQQQVGLTGRAVAPSLYVAIGLRGNFNHTVGILGAGTIVAINRDVEAPIFDSADVGIVGDWREVTAALLDILSARD